MIDLSNDSLLMIEPTGAPSAEPVIDHLTRLMAGALNDAMATQNPMRYRGCHPCTGDGCEAMSDNAEWYVTVNATHNVVTNSLAVHYLAHHRSEVPAVELRKLEWLAGTPVEPTPHQLSGTHAPADQRARRPRTDGFR